MTKSQHAAARERALERKVEVLLIEVSELNAVSSERKEAIDNLSAELGRAGRHIKRLTNRGRA